MLRIFGGDRHVDGGVRPEQRESDAGAQTESNAADGTTTMPPVAKSAPPTAGHPEPAKSGPDAATPGPGPEAAKPEAAKPEAAKPEAAKAGVEDSEPGFLERGRMRRRARFLRAARELAYRDLGGLVFDLHRFSQRNDDVVKAKLDTLTRIDSELRHLESSLHERKSVTVLREAGVAACPRCAAIHGSGDRFCPTCGLSVDQAERPIAGPNAAAPAPVPASAAWPPPSSSWPPPQWATPQPSAPGAPTPGGGGVPIPAPTAQSQSPWHSPEQSVAPGTDPVPAAGRTRPRSGSAPPRAEDAHAGLPAAPAKARSEQPPESQTEVIRPQAQPAGTPQRTVAFDPLSPLATRPEGGEERRPGQGRT